MFTPVRRWTLRCKRGFDIVFALIALLFALPILAIVAVWILAAAGKPLFYSESRLGLNGQPFKIYKFRTLAAGTSQQCSIATTDDARITAPGRLLRRTRLDELPQLWQVVNGTMSVVGPRPLSLKHAATIDPSSLEKMQSFRPGCTGAAALDYIADDEVLANWVEDGGNARHEHLEQLYLSAILPQKVAADILYVENWSLGLDIKLLVRTILMFISRKSREASRHRVKAVLDLANRSSLNGS